jgi:organic hydroperoxide reductase OsmC/OhrA
MTFHAIARISKLRFESFEVSIEGTVNKSEGGLQFTQIGLRPTLRIADGQDVDRARAVLEKTGRSCLVSRSLSTPIHIEPRVRLYRRSLKRQQRYHEMGSDLGIEAGCVEDPPRVGTS